MNFTSRFKSLIDRSGISQKDLSKAVGYTQQTISKWYNGRTEPDTETIKKIANYFNVTTDYLLGNDNKNTENEKEQKELNILKELLIKNNFMNEEEDLTKVQINKLMKFVNANKEFLKENK